MADIDNSTIPFISDQLDEFFSEFGVSFIALISILAILFGTFIAYFGSKGQGPKVLGFVAGFLVGAYLGAVVLELVGKKYEIGNETWVGLFFASGAFVGFISYCLVKIAPLIIGLSAGLVISGVMYQIGLAEVIGNNTVMLVIAIVVCLITVYLACKVLELVYAILAAFMGGAFVILGMGHFTNSPITLNAVASDPENSLDNCIDARCYAPVGVGIAIIVLALIKNILGWRKKRKEKQKGELAKYENDQLVAQMQEDRKLFEKRFQELQQNNQKMLKSLEDSSADREKNFLKAFQAEIKKQDKSTEQKLKELEIKLEEQKTLNLEKEHNKEVVIAELELEKKELEMQILKEKELQKETSKEIVRRESMIVDDEDGDLNMKLDNEYSNELGADEEEKDRKAMLLSLQQEAAEGKLRLEDLENDFKEAVRLEKRMKVQLPKELKRKRNFFDDDDMLERESEEIKEIRLRAEEFAKMKSLVNKAKSAQRETLRRLKKAFKDIEKLSSNLRKLSRKNILKADDQVVKKEKEFGLEDMTLKMTVLRSLMEKYEEMSAQFLELIREMEEKFTEFKQAEKRIEAYGMLSEDQIDQLPTAAFVGAGAGAAAGAQQVDPEAFYADVKAIQDPNPAAIEGEGGEGVDPDVEQAPPTDPTLAPEDVDPALIGANAAVAGAAGAGVAANNQFTAEQVLDGEAPRNYVYRDSYFPPQDRMSHREMNIQIYRWMRVRMPRLFSFFEASAARIRTAMRNGVQRARERINERRAMHASRARPSQDLEIDLEVAPSPISVRVNAPSAAPAPTSAPSPSGGGNAPTNVDSML